MYRRYAWRVGGLCKLKRLRNYSAKSLGSIVKLDLFEQETPEKITSIWREHHKKLPCLSAAVPVATFEQFKPKITQCPMFVFPIPKHTGYISVVMQAKMEINSVLFTKLEDWQQQQTLALPAITVCYYTELAQSKGLVLMRGDVDTRTFTTQEAQYLINQLQLFYSFDEQKYALVKKFNSDPANFDYDQVLKCMDTLR